MTAQQQPKICFCGSDPVVKPDGNARYWLVECGSCGRASIHCRTRDEAVEEWNNPFRDEKESENGDVAKPES